MMYFIRTQIPTRVIKDWFDHDFLFWGKSVPIADKLKQILSRDYPKIQQKDILIYMRKNCVVNKDTDNIVKISFRNTNNHMFQLLQLLEFGNRELESPHYISNIMNKVLSAIKFKTGGI